MRVGGSKSFRRIGSRDLEEFRSFGIFGRLLEDLRGPKDAETRFLKLSKITKTDGITEILGIAKIL